MLKSATSCLWPPSFLLTHCSTSTSLLAFISLPLALLPLYVISKDAELLVLVYQKAYLFLEVL